MTLQGIALTFGNLFSSFSEFLKSRTNTGLNDRIVIEALPKIPGIYRRNLIIPDIAEKLNKYVYNRILTEDSPYFSSPYIL